MPIAAAIPLITSVGGAALSAFGGSGNQGGQKTNNIQDLTEHGTTHTNQTQTSTGHQTSTSNLSDTQQQQTAGANINVEDPLATLFRYGQFANLNNEIKRAQDKPIFGDAQKAGFLNQLNDMSDLSMKSLSGNLAKHGALNSGAFAQGASDLEMNRYGQMSNFFAQLPFQEEAARAARLNPLLGLGAQMAGHGPVSQFTSGSMSGTRNASQTGEVNTDSTTNLTGDTTTDKQTHGTNQGTTTAQGPGFIKGLFDNIGGGLASGSTFGLGGLFKKWFPGGGSTSLDAGGNG
jgi:hypothetical protein